MVTKTKSDLLIAAKAIHDEVKTSVAGMMQDKEIELSLKLQKSVATINKDLHDTIKKLEQRIDALQEMHKNSMERIEKLIKALADREKPVVNVQVPQARLVKKEITYDQYNRPAVIQERDG